jgi:hypothetical protein
MTATLLRWPSFSLSRQNHEAAFQADFCCLRCSAYIFFVVRQRFSPGARRGDLGFVVFFS